MEQELLPASCHFFKHCLVNDDFCLMNDDVNCGQDTSVDELSHESSLQNFYMESLRDGFVGRKTLLKQCTSTLQNSDTGLLVITGKHGSGKSSLMVKHF